MKWVRDGMLCAVVTGAVAVAVVAPTAASTPRAHAAVCVGATDIEAIIDDSGSMAATDPDKLRVKGLKLLINTLSPRTFLGAVEFGGKFFSGDRSVASDTVFSPEPVGRNATAMGRALDSTINANNGGTDYNAGFAQSDHDNPNANARIFLTDGGHDIGDYNNGHLVHRVPTYVIGFSSGIASAGDQARLRQIANDTGGAYYPQTDSSRLQSVMNTIGAALTCGTRPQSFTDSLKQGATKSHRVAIGAKTKSVQVALTWSSPLDRFAITNLRLVNNRGKTIATSSRVKKLKIRVTKSSTFILLKVSNLSRASLTFAVKALKIGSGNPKVRLTTQIRQAK